MFDFDIKISPKSTLTKLLVCLPRSFYIIFSIITFIIFLGIVFYGATSLSLIVFFISVISLTYKESWSFDKETKKIISKFGLGFVYKTTLISFEDIELCELLTFTKGKLHNQQTKDKNNIFTKKYISIKLYTKDGKTYTIITVSERKKEMIDSIINEIESITHAKIER